MLECGGGWIGHWMDRLDEFLESYSWAVPPLSLKPSEYFQRQCVVSFDPGEHTAPMLHAFAGADTFIWASDFPHSDAKYPGVVDELTEYTEGMEPQRARRAVRAERGPALRPRRTVMSEYDLVVRGGRVCDGTGEPAFSADLAVRDGRVAVVGRVDPSDAKRVIDADGLWVTPGFIDVHTHYDAQLYFEPTCSPSSWHGVTTVFTGNCGFTFAPARSAEDLDWLLAMLSRVEGMSPDGLKEGVSYRGGSFRDFLDGLSSGGIGVNVAANVGHCALRRWVMGDEASERVATDDEVAQMCALLRSGAGRRCGRLHVLATRSPRRPRRASCSVQPRRTRGAGRARRRGRRRRCARHRVHSPHVPSRLRRRRSRAHPEDVPRLGVAGEHQHAVEDPALARWMEAQPGVRRGGGRPGLRVLPQFAANHQGAHFSLDTTFLFDEYDTMRSCLTATSGQREQQLRDPSVRDKLRVELADWTGKSFLFVPQVMRFEVVHHAPSTRAT